MAKPYSYYYNAQIKNYLAQVMRIFVGLQVRYGVDRDGDGNNEMKQVHVHYGDMERIVANVLYKENVFQAASLPVISGTLTELALNPDARVSTKHKESIVRLRESDGTKIAYERLMGIPMKMGMDVSIYTSNNDQMLQLLEQIFMLFNPYLTIQKSEDLSDWSYITRVELVNITNDRNTPTGTDDRMIVQTLGLTTDIWLNYPEKEYTGIINEILVNVKDNTYLIEGIDMDTFTIP